VDTLGAGWNIKGSRRACLSGTNLRLRRRATHFRLCDWLEGLLRAKGSAPADQVRPLGGGLDASMSRARSSGAKGASNNASAHPAGPALAIRTSKSIVPMAMASPAAEL
jgi:hypothetical protein